MENAEWIFVWRDHLFMSKIHRGQLLLKWTPLSTKATTNLLLDNELLDANSSEQIVEDPSSVSTTSLNLDHKEKEFKYLTYGFTFDPGCFDKIPVMVLASKSYISQPTDSKVNDKCLLICVRIKNFGILNNESPKKFELMILRSFHINDKTNDTFVNQNFTATSNFRVASFFNMIFLATLSATLEVYTVGGVSSYSLFSRDECPTPNQIEILDIFCNCIRHETFILFSYLDEMKIKKVKCIKLQLNSCFDNIDSPLHKTSQNSLNIPLEAVSQRFLFNSDYSQLVSAVKLVSLSSEQQARSESINYSSNVIILTNTGFLLRFVNGIITSCVHIWSSLHESCSFTEPEWSMAKFNFISMRRGSMESVAVQVDSTCLLIDVEKEQVIKVWQSVLFISKVTNDQSTSPHLVMVMHLADGNKGKQWDLLDEGENIQIIDPFTVSCTHDTEDVEIGSNFMGQSSEESRRSSVPECAADALLAQKKKYEISVMEAKNELARKEQFLVETWKKLQQLSAETCETTSHHTHSQLMPLLEVSPQRDYEEKCADIQSSHIKYSYLNHEPGDYNTSTKQSSCLTHGSGKTRVGGDAHSYIQVIGEPWKRTIESLLVVGVLVRNVCDRPIFGAHIHLLPVGACSFSMLECVSSEKPTNMADYTSSLTTNASSNLQAGSERTLTCFVDTAQMLSPGDVKFLLNITFSVNSSKPKSDELVDVRKQDKQIFNFNINCGDIMLSTQDLISAKYSLVQDFIRMKTEPSVDFTISMLALDCVQKSITLIIQSKVSSVLCLESKLNSHPHFLATCGCHIFVADHQLRLCRVKRMIQVSKKEGEIQILTRTDSQAVLLVKFLHSILPEDVTLFPELPSPSLSLQYAHNLLHKELQRKIDTIKGELEAAIKVDLEAEDEEDRDIEKDDHPSLCSPTFHSKKNMRCKVGTKGSIEASVSKEILASNVKNDSGSNVDNERKKFLKAKRRLNEKLGVDGSS